MSKSFEEILTGLRDSPDETEKLFKELKQLPEIDTCVRALVLYAKSLTKNAKLLKHGARYVLSPRNFVAFTPRYKRASHVTVEVRGSEKEFERVDGLMIKNSRAGSYSKFDFRNPGQLAAAVAYIRRANQLCAKGATRDLLVDFRPI
jgi:hypothetical protein